MPRLRWLPAIVVLVAACGGAPSDVASVSAPASVPPVRSDALPVIITTDLAADDILAVMALLREPAVDVRAIAVDGNGEVHCAPGLRNIRFLLDAFGHAPVPAGCGREEPGAHGRLFPDAWRAGADSFYGLDGLPDADSAPWTDAGRLIVDAAADAPAPVTIVALGPWSSIADAFARDPTLPDRLAGIHAMIGAIDVPGNIAVDDVTPEDGVEWNAGVDPDAVADVVATDVPITIVPLDATNDVPVPPDFAETLGEAPNAAGRNVAFEMYRKTPQIMDGTSFWDTLAAAALVDPSLVSWDDADVRIEREGASAGRFVRDPGGRPIRAAMSADRDRFMAALLAALDRGPQRPDPFAG